MRYILFFMFAPIVFYFVYNVARDPLTPHLIKELWFRIRDRMSGYLGEEEEEDQWDGRGSREHVGRRNSERERLLRVGVEGRSRRVRTDNLSSGSERKGARKMFNENRRSEGSYGYGDSDSDYSSSSESESESESGESDRTSDSGESSDDELYGRRSYDMRAIARKTAPGPMMRKRRTNQEE